jgi:large subunit ribosomal protein L11
MAEVVEVLVSGGKATAGPPLGPALGPLGINVKAVVDEINRKTGEFNGMQVPVRVEVDDRKQFTISVGVPPTTALIKKEAAVRIAKMKAKDMLSYDLKHGVKEVIGTCVSLGVTVNGRRPKEIFTAIDAGEFDSALK